MKLLNISVTYILLLILSALAVWGFYFYFSIKAEFYENIDEFLRNREYEIRQEIKANPQIVLKRNWPKTDFKIKEINKEDFHKLREGLHDINIFEPLEMEEEPYRRLETKFSIGGMFYRLTIDASLLDTEEVIETIIDGLILLFIILVVLLFFVNRLLMQKLWKPFYVALRGLEKYRLDKESTIALEETRVKEFKELNLAISELVKRSYVVFQDQKQFIENASHEMQTPLAKASGKIELLIQDPHLVREVAEGLQSINQDLDKLTALNKGLLLLSKIENDQFHEKEIIDIGKAVNKISEEFAEFLEFKELSLNITKQGTIAKYMNPVLADILFINLMKNAIYHNIERGYINIFIEQNEFRIINTGKEYRGDTSALFNRFVKSSDRSESLGLGLSIIKSIGDLYGYNIYYKISGNLHEVLIKF